ncbi:MAG: cupin domain-containing protein [Candidatus Glassbacteria bacterium]|nr:cupin domain-containing protein [Candidatus Glassbacteria bacterium]
MKSVDYKTVELEDFSAPGAKGAGIRWLISEADGAENYAMRMIELEPGGQSPSHTHGSEHEVFVWRGQGEVRLEGAAHPLAPGTVVFVPPDVHHQFVNTSDRERIEFICVIPIERK